MFMKPRHVQCKVSPEGRTFAPACNSINYSSGPSEFLNFSVYLLFRVWTPNHIQGPHFGIPGSYGVRGVNDESDPNYLRTASDFVFEANITGVSDSKTPVEVPARLSSLSMRAKTSNTETSEFRDCGVGGTSVFLTALRSKVDISLTNEETALE